MYCHVCGTAFCPDCVKSQGEYNVCISGACKGRLSQVKSDEDRERRKRQQEDERKERAGAKKETSIVDVAGRTFIFGWFYLFLLPFIALFKWLIAKVDKRRKK
ncbi:MAG: hypothetical protein HQM09_19175 [Candidatus Riflebacteria bacterium]|nr:hypothetical protein [Candidatus Riflebacteria bacterium]